jgi:uncharacterized protein (DUF1499 family)
MSDTVVAANPSGGKYSRTVSILTKLAVWLGVICAIASVASGLGHRFDLWHFRTGFVILRYATFGGFAVLVLALIGTIMAQAKHLKAPRTTGLVGLALGIIISGPPLYQYYLATHVPPIHDISTDLLNPPTYVAVPPLRAKDDNSLEISADTQKKQAEAFPDLKSDLVAVPPEQALSRAEKVAKAMGWEIVAVDPKAGRMEATATTLLYGFKDDVVVRITPEATGSRVDVRSASRVGRSDVGVNARRIREFQKQFNAANS